MAPLIPHSALVSPCREWVRLSNFSSRRASCTAWWSSSWLFWSTRPSSLEKRSVQYSLGQVDITALLCSR